MLYEVDRGWLCGAEKRLSPNFGPRPPGCAPELLVIHNISLPPGCYGGNCIERFFTNCLDWEEHAYFDEIRGIQVSAHLLIKRLGEVLQFVSSRSAPGMRASPVTEDARTVTISVSASSLRAPTMNPITMPSMRLFPP